MTAAERMADRVAEGKRRIADRSNSVEKGGGGGDNSGMDARVANLEADVKDIKKDLVDLKVSAAALSAKMDIVVAKMPSWWQAPVGAGGLIALLAALIGLAKSLHWF